jgi:uncharacterized protein
VSAEPVDVDPTLPETVRRFLASGAKLESIRLDAHGQWWHQGGRFENRRVIDLFARSVDRTQGGTWVVNVGQFTYPIEVEDTPFFVTAFAVEADGDVERVILRLVGGESELLDPDTLAYDGDLGISCAVRAGRFRARFLKAPYYALTERLEEDALGFGLRLAGRLVRL